jgi:hypothetical protein
MGGWVRGLGYGFHTKGERYSLYVDGKTITNQPVIQLINNGSDVRTVTYTPSSESADIYAKGSAQLVNGEVVVNFSDAFKSAINNDVVITVTPNGESKGVYIAQSDKNGFKVKENAGGASNITFSWIAVGTRKDADTYVSPEIVNANFDKKMDAVMFNENNNQENAGSVWFDGKDIRFDKPYEELRMQKIVASQQKSKAKQIASAVQNARKGNKK